MSYYPAGYRPLTPITPAHSPHPSAGSFRSRTPGQLSLHEYRKLQNAPSPGAVDGQRKPKRVAAVVSLKESVERGPFLFQKVPAESNEEEDNEEETQHNARLLMRGRRLAELLHERSGDIHEVGFLDGWERAAELGEAGVKSRTDAVNEKRSGRRVTFAMEDDGLRATGLATRWGKARQRHDFEISSMLLQPSPPPSPPSPGSVQLEGRLQHGENMAATTRSTRLHLDIPQLPSPIAPFSYNVSFAPSRIMDSRIISSSEYYTSPESPVSPGEATPAVSVSAHSQSGTRERLLDGQRSPDARHGDSPKTSASGSPSPDAITVRRDLNLRPIRRLPRPEGVCPAPDLTSLAQRRKPSRTSLTSSFLSRSSSPLSVRYSPLVQEESTPSLSQFPAPPLALQSNSSPASDMAPRNNVSHNPFERRPQNNIPPESELPGPADPRQPSPTHDSEVPESVYASGRFDSRSIGGSSRNPPYGVRVGQLNYTDEIEEASRIHSTVTAHDSTISNLIGNYHHSHIFQRSAGNPPSFSPPQPPPPSRASLLPPPLFAHSDVTSIDSPIYGNTANLLDNQTLESVGEPVHSDESTESGCEITRAMVDQVNHKSHDESDLSFSREEGAQLHLPFTGSQHAQASGERPSTESADWVTIDSRSRSDYNNSGDIPLSPPPPLPTTSDRKMLLDIVGSAAESANFRNNAQSPITPPKPAYRTPHPIRTLQKPSPSELDSSSTQYFSPYGSPDLSLNYTPSRIPGSQVEDPPSSPAPGFVSPQRERSLNYPEPLSPDSPISLLSPGTIPLPQSPTDNSTFLHTALQNSRLVESPQEARSSRMSTHATTREISYAEWARSYTGGGLVPNEYLCTSPHDDIEENSNSDSSKQKYPEATVASKDLANPFVDRTHPPIAPAHYRQGSNPFDSSEGSNSDHVRPVQDRFSAIPMGLYETSELPQENPRGQYELQEISPGSPQSRPIWNHHLERQEQDEISPTSDISTPGQHPRRARSVRGQRSLLPFELQARRHSPQASRQDSLGTFATYHSRGGESMQSQQTRFSDFVPLSAGRIGVNSSHDPLVQAGQKIVPRVGESNGRRLGGVAHPQGIAVTASRPRITSRWIRTPNERAIAAAERRGLHTSEADFSLRRPSAHEPQLVAPRERASSSTMVALAARKKKLSWLVFAMGATFPPLLLLVGTGRMDPLVVWMSGGEIRHVGWCQRRAAWAVLTLELVALTVIPVLLVWAHYN